MNQLFSGAMQIQSERIRQQTEEGWTPEHDDKHTDCELLRAAACYMVVPGSPLEAAESWPWEKSWWKPSHDPVRNLVKAGALIAAEIDRIQRLKGEDV